MSFLKHQLNLFFIALAFLSRIHVPASVDFSQHNLNRASRYFPLIGWLIGLICAATYLLALQIFPTHISVLLSMIVSVLLTGCFHEDGFADSCDGLGGGWSIQQKLSIMKDSRIGTYGSVGIWMMLTLKFCVLISLPNVAIALLVAHPLSRAVSTSLIFLLPYVSDAEQSKVKPLAEAYSINDLYINLLIGASALLLVLAQAFTIVIALLIAVMIIRFWLKRQLQGFTGDTLGATQQICEVLIYLVLLAGVHS